MRSTRIALGLGVVVLVAFMLVIAIGIHGAASPVIAVLALGGLIACGNLLYGKHSHGAAAAARVRPAQQAQNRAIDEAHERARLERAQAQERERAQQERERAQQGRERAPRRRREGSR